MFEKLFKRLKGELKEYVDYRVEERLTEMFEEGLEEFTFEEETSSPSSKSIGTGPENAPSKEAGPFPKAGPPPKEGGELPEVPTTVQPSLDRSNTGTGKNEEVALLERYEDEHGKVPEKTGDNLTEEGKTVLAFCQTFRKPEPSPSFREVRKKSGLSHHLIMSAYNELEDKGWMTRQQAQSGFRRPIEFHYKLDDKAVASILTKYQGD